MKEFKGTKGTWSINPLTNPVSPTYWCIYVKPGDHKTVSHICLIDSKDALNVGEAEHNAKLIAAAPELLEALQELLKFCKSHNMDNYYTGAAEGIIDKALS